MSRNPDWTPMTVSPADSEPISSFDPSSLTLERLQDADAVAALIERAFGPGRYAKAAERLREGNQPLLDLSFTCWSVGDLIGCVRLWPIHIGERAAIFLGPFAVESEQRSQGLGAALIRRACAAARDAGHGLILLVGDEPYFAPLGFHMVPPGRIVMPGPVDPRRVLVQALKPGAADDLGGVVRAG
jgi:predicted N-acetyltransferase YhbS